MSTGESAHHALTAGSHQSVSLLQMDETYSDFRTKLFYTASRFYLDMYNFIVENVFLSDIASCGKFTLS